MAKVVKGKVIKKAPVKVQRYVRYDKVDAMTKVGWKTIALPKDDVFAKKVRQCGGDLVLMEK